MTTSHRRRVRAILEADPGLETAAIVARVGCGGRLVQHVRLEIGIPSPGTQIGACGTESRKRVRA